MSEHVIEVILETPVERSFHVMQVAGMFDLPLETAARQRIALTIPPQSEDWQIGLIVGPSGSGKSTLAQRLFADRLMRDFSWPDDRAIIDAFGPLPVKETVQLLTAVGFSSPPAWLRPYRVLSNGEQARCNLARGFAGALQSPPSGGREPWHILLPPQADRKRPLVACDEFTSVVDRHVARAIAAGLAKRIRSGTLPCRFVAITCHYDVAEWLTPDWIIDMATQQFTRSFFRRSEITLAVVPCRREAWRAYRRHHYLSGQLPAAAECYLAVWDNNAVGFCAVASQIGQQNYRRISRLVVLPEYQGMGIGSAFLEAVARYYRGQGQRVGITTSHPAMIAHLCRSPLWRLRSVRKYGSRGGGPNLPQYKGSFGRAVMSFEFLGKASPQHPCAA
ncbi:MAG: GNAT family N-acetyltransferase [Thermogutta sp.]